MYERIINLIGEDNFNRIEKTKILLVGIGGVGGFAFEALIRSGFKDITIIDKDIFDITNLNRQLLATKDTLNKRKVDIARERGNIINENVSIKGYNEFLSKDNINNLDKDYDFIIDACDTLNTKLELIRFASINNIKIISSMGMGNRVDASKIKICKLKDTKNDPLAKKLRKLVKDNNLSLDIPVVISDELPLMRSEVNSMITSPGIAGLLMVNYIINKTIE